MFLTDERIIKYLDKRLAEHGLDKEKFLNPKISDLRDANNLFNMDKAVSKIKKAIEEHKRILVYGDYDSDGICASTILYLFLKSVGADVNVFIPNRFVQGYGISSEAIEEIEERFAPELIITVDLGITAIQEVEILKQEGIDIVITDHHIPLDEIPDCIVVDPKLDPEGKYGFDAICGAGVAFKLVEAMAGRKEALRYLDICAIATVGDIVALIDENRVIAKLGIEKINMGYTLPSIKLLLKKLGITKLTSTDISFKVVPRINACGRMDNALKVFEFMIETDPLKLEEKYAEMEKDNNTRLDEIASGMKIINRELENYNRNEPSLMVVGNFHEGILGILASRLCHEFNKPAIVFSRDDSGRLRGSGRSVECVDMHKIIGSMSDIVDSFGGHKMACGLDIQEDNFNTFKDRFNAEIEKIAKPSDFWIDDSKYDIELTENDLSEEFYRQLELLEPFGYYNEKPVLAITEKMINALPINDKSFKHYLLHTKENNTILGFNFYDYVGICRTNSEKLVFVDIDSTIYKGKKCLNIISRGIKLKSVNLPSNQEQDFMSALYNKYYSIHDFNDMSKYHIEKNLPEIVKQKFAENDYGTIVVVSSNSDIEKLESAGIETSKYITCKAFKNGQNAIVVSPRQIYKLESTEGYNNIIFMHRYFSDEHLFYSQKLNTYENYEIEKKPYEISLSREAFASVYRLVSGFSLLKSNDILDFVDKLSQHDNNLSKSQIMFSVIVFMELNFIEYDDKTNGIIILKSKKMELSSSKFFHEAGENG